jgi:hypothetical protein
MIDIVLLVLKIAILVLLYLFVWLMVRSATRDVFAASTKAAPDVALPEPPPPPSPPTHSERRARRERRAAERTMAGESLDLMAHLAPRLVVEQSPIVPSGVVFPLEGWLTVGRSPASDIVLDEPYVSQTHARIVQRGQLFVVEDLGSTNGTFINEKAVTEAPLRLDCRLRIGETVFRYEE